MATPLLPDELWSLIQPMLPPPRSKPKGGRPRLPDRACLTGVLFVLRSGIPWEMLPQELGCGSGMSCWRRVRDWQQTGIWQMIHFALLDCFAASIKSTGPEPWWIAAVRAVFGGSKPAQIPPIGLSSAANAM